MAVAATLGGASPNFDSQYQEVTRLSKKLSVPSPRVFENPGETLQLTVVALNGGVPDPTIPPQPFDLTIRAYYGKEGSQPTYMLYYKDPLGNQQLLSDGTNVQPLALAATFFNPPPGGIQFKVNGQVIAAGDVLKLDPDNARIVFNNTTAGVYSKTNLNNANVGVMKLDAANGLDVGLLNDRISSTNLAIEALNKVLIVANNNLDKSVELRL